MKITYWNSLLCCFFATFLSAQKGIESRAKYALDKNSKKTESTYNSLHFKSFKSKERINIGYNENDAVWCVIKCKNTTNAKLKRLLVIDNIFLDSVTCWIKGKSTVMGDRTSIQDAYISAYTIPIEFESKEEIEIKLRIKKTISILNFNYYFDTEKTISNSSRNQLGLISVFIGFLLFLIFFYTFIYYHNRKKIYFIFILYLVVSLIYVSITSGFARYILTPNLFYLGEFRIFSGSFWYVFFGWFFLELFSLKKHHSTLYSILRYSLILLCGVILSAAFCVIFQFYTPLIYITFTAYLFYALILILILISAIRHIKINAQVAFYAIISFIFHFIWQIVTLLIAFKILPDKLNLDWFVYVSVFQAILFGYLLAKNYIDSFFQKIKLEKEIVAEKDRSIQIISKSQISERKKIANILHDNFGVKIAQIMHLTESQDKKALQEQIINLSDEIRNVSHTILPKSLNDGALIYAIEKQFEIFKISADGLNLNLSTFDFPIKIEMDWRYDLYLISIEIIHNAIKHGKADEIDLEFFGYPESFVFQFIDNGLGFDVINTSGFGLDSIRQRIEQLGGTFELNSNRESGTTIHIHIPR
jgi:signal transduction histidine kinase